MIFAFFKLLATFLAFILPPIQQETYTYKKVGETALDLVVYQPTYNTSAINKMGSPVLLTIHGGGFVFGAKDGEGAIFDRQIREFASRGWTIVSINYRLAPPSFISDMVEDMQDAYKWIRKKLPALNPSPIDTDLICVFGRSAGGGLALIAGKHLHPRVPCIISFFPYGADLLDNEFYDTTHPPSQALTKAVKHLSKVTIESAREKETKEWRSIVFDLIFREKKGGWLLASHDPREDPKKVKERLKPYSPIDIIDQHYPPTWIGHGTKDTLVPHHSSVRMKERLEKEKRPVVLDLTEEGHSFDKKGSHMIWRDHVIPPFDWAAIQIENHQKEKGSKGK